MKVYVIVYTSALTDYIEEYETVFATRKEAKEYVYNCKRPNCFKIIEETI